MKPIERICLLGLGEVGQKLAMDLHSIDGLKLAAFDILFADPASIPSRAIGRMPFLRPARSTAEAAANCELIISAVTAAEAVTAARAVCGVLAAGCIYLDLNSVAPATREQAATIIEDAGGRFVEVAVMSAIHPKGVAAPMLLGGPHVSGLVPQLNALGFSGASHCSAKIGPPSATKMCRSVLVKGFEALLTESMLAARYYGVEADVLASLDDLLPAPDWPQKSRYMISRSIEHGVRRAEEMREVMRTVEQAGIEPLMSTACAARQSWAAQYTGALAEPELQGMLDAIAAMNRRSG